MMCSLSNPARRRPAVGTTLVVVGLVTAFAACPTRTRLGAADRNAVVSRYAGQSFFLKQSLYYGPFYDDNARSLVSARTFASLKLMTAPDGEIIVPPPPQGIIPAGSKVRVVAVEFPTSANIVKRPLFTPRYNIWVILKVGRFGTDVEFYRPQDHVLVLPTTTRSSEEIELQLAALLGADDLSAWLAGRSDAARLAIFEKRVQEGLTYEELTAAYGMPDEIERRFEGSTKIESARYGDTTVELRDDVVTRTFESPPAGEPPAPADADAPSP